MYSDTPRDGSPIESKEELPKSTEGLPPEILEEQPGEADLEEESIEDPPVDNIEDFPSLCNKAIVEEACRRMQHLDNNPHSATLYKIGALLGATRVSTITFLTHLGMNMSGINSDPQFKLAQDPATFSCANLCRLVVQSIPEDILPPKSDLGCHGSPGHHACDIDLKPHALKKINFNSKNRAKYVPHGRRPHELSRTSASRISINGIGLRPSVGPRSVSFVEGLTRLANFFRVYPMLRLTIDDEEEISDIELHDDDLESYEYIEDQSGADSMLMEMAASTSGGSGAGCNVPMCLHKPSRTWQCHLANLCGACQACKSKGPKGTAGPKGAANNPSSQPKKPKVDWKQNVERVSTVAQAYVARAIQLFPEDTKHLKNWFGISSPVVRQRVLFVLASLSGMLWNVEYTRNSEECSKKTYAYVYPEGEKARNADGQFIFHLCPQYFKGSRYERIATHVHEGTHHEPTYTLDVCADPGEVRDSTNEKCIEEAYGRKTCRYVALNFPEKALENADNFAYYINELNKR